jgi:alcohol dehydrogenase (NADP+)
MEKGDIVGVGCFVDSDRTCAACRAGEEQLCEGGMTLTYNGYERDGKTPTYGGYSTRITVDENYVLKIPKGLPLERAAPLLCAGITTYSPLKYFGLEAGDKLAVVGLGGLGHMGVKFGHALGAHVTVLSHSPGKRQDALKLGADDFIATKDEDILIENAGRFDFILDTISAKHDYNSYLNLLHYDGVMVLVGVPDEPAPLSAPSLILKRRTLAGSDRRYPRDAGDARLLRREGDRRLCRGDFDRSDQRGLRAHAQERRALSLRHRHREPQINLPKASA